LRYSAEAPEVEEGVGLAAEAGGGAEATLRSGEADDAGVAGGVEDAGAAKEADDTEAEDDAGEAGDVDDAEEAGAADEAVSAEEDGEVDDAEKREKDEHAASIGINAIAAAAAPKRRTPPRPAICPSTPTRRRHPFMPHLYQAPGVNHKVRAARRNRSPGSRLCVWRNLIPAAFYR
jgi:hypothetical protein